MTGHPEELVPPWSIAGLPARRAWVWVGPPLAARPENRLDARNVSGRGEAAGSPAVEVEAGGFGNGAGTICPGAVGDDCAGQGDGAAEGGDSVGVVGHGHIGQARAASGGGKTTADARGGGADVGRSVCASEAGHVARDGGVGDGQGRGRVDAPTVATGAAKGAAGIDEGSRSTGAAAVAADGVPGQRCGTPTRVKAAAIAARRAAARGARSRGVAGQGGVGQAEGARISDATAVAREAEVRAPEE